MRLLVDHNLSPRLIADLSDVFPGSVHVSEIGLAEAEDAEVWEYARQNALTVVTKDEDFSMLAALNGAPPKVVWLRLGNCSTRQVESKLRQAARDMERFLIDPAKTTLVLR